MFLWNTTDSKAEHEGARVTEAKIKGIDFLTFSVGEKAGRDLPGGERVKENVVRKQSTRTSSGGLLWGLAVTAELWISVMWKAERG